MQQIKKLLQKIKDDEKLYTLMRTTNYLKKWIKKLKKYENVTINNLTELMI